MQDAVQDRDLLNYVELFVPKDFASCAVCGRPAAMSEVSYVLPPTDEMYDVLLQGLKRFSEDLQTGATDSSALGYGWSPAPFAAKISAPRLLRPKPPSLSLSLRDAEVRPPAPASARTAMPSTPERPRRPSSAGRRNDEPLPRMSGRGPNGAQTASELKLKAQGSWPCHPPSPPGNGRRRICTWLSHSKLMPWCNHQFSRALRLRTVQNGRKGQGRPRRRNCPHKCCRPCTSSREAWALLVRSQVQKRDSNFM